MTYNEDRTRVSSSSEDAEAVKRSMLSTIKKLQNETKLIFADAESALTAAKAVRMVSFKKEDVCQPDPIAHDYDNMDDNLRKETLLAEKKLALSEAGQRRSREIIRTLASKINDMLEDAFDQECERIACVRHLSERLTVANDDRRKIIKQRDFFSEQLKEEISKNHFADVKTKKEIVEEKMEQMKDELADLKKKSDENDRDLRRLRKERDDLKQENARILREQTRLTTEYENKFEEMKVNHKSTIKKLVAEANSSIDQLIVERDLCSKAFMKLFNDSNVKKELLNKQVKQQLTSNYPKTMKDLQENNRDVESRMDEIRSMPTSNYHDRMRRLHQQICSTSESPDNDSLTETYPKNHRR